mmetsp:Transcript_144986/g.403858  ORF Transcript_144986/g.403858 Transcript_144986/m.403858 type:complete len:223 (-) Transcript_144986:768-1436(-)
MSAVSGPARSPSSCETTAAWPDAAATARNGELSISGPSVSASRPTTELCPFSAAAANADSSMALSRCIEFATTGGAPVGAAGLPRVPTSSSAMSLWPRSAASTSGANPSGEMAAVSPPREMSVSTTLRWPASAARWIARRPRAASSASMSSPLLEKSSTWAMSPLAAARLSGESSHRTRKLKAKDMRAPPPTCDSTSCSRSGEKSTRRPCLGVTTTSSTPGG